MVKQKLIRMQTAVRQYTAPILELWRNLRRLTLTGIGYSRISCVHCPHFFLSLIGDLCILEALEREP